MGIAFSTLPLAVQARMKAMRGKGTVRKPEMNRGETSYRDHLEAQKRWGEIAEYWFELIKVRLADKTFYTVDFLVMLPDGALEGHEVKGRKGKADGGETYWAEEDARIKIKVAAEVVPWPFFVVFPKRGGGWAKVEI